MDMEAWHAIVHGLSKKNWTKKKCQKAKPIPLYQTIISSVQLLSRVQFFVTPWTPARQDFLSINNSWSLFKLMSIESVMPSNHTILCRSLLLLPSIFPSIRVFFPMSQFFTAVAKVLEFQLQHHFLQ